MSTKSTLSWTKHKEGKSAKPTTIDEGECFVYDVMEPPTNGDEMINQMVPETLPFNSHHQSDGAYGGIYVSS